MKRNIRIGKNNFCGTCGYLKTPGEISDCNNCYQKEKEKMISEFNEY